jgi:hypothetical protein
LRPTIIVFAKAPVLGRVKTRLGLPPEQAAGLHERFVRETLALVAPLGNVELWTDAPTGRWGEHALQSGGDLGARMLNALQSRPAPVMIVGSDAPDVPAAFLEELIALEVDVALGPATDGGFYAIACHRTHPDMFAGVSWSTAVTLLQTVAACEACGLTVALGRECSDIDTPEDLKRYLMKYGHSETSGR